MRPLSLFAGCLFLLSALAQGGPNDPVAEHFTQSIGYQTASALTLAATDPDTAANLLVYSIVNPPLNGTLTGSGSARTYTPQGGFSGTDTFTYKANDGSADSNIATFTLNVLPAPAAPTGLTLSASAFYTTLVNGSLAGLLQGVDPNPDDRFTFALVTGSGSTHNGYFSVVGNQLIATRSFAADAGQTISLRLKVTDSTGNALEQVITRLVEAVVLSVKINEINYNPARNTQLSEFIELYNPSASAVDLSGWRLSGGVDYVIPAGTSIAAGGYKVIAANPATLQALYGVNALGPWTGGLSSDGEKVVLSDAQAAMVDEVDYGITAPWPVPPNGDGPSLELVNPKLENDYGGNWRASTVAPTVFNYLSPGASDWHYRKGTSEASSPLGAWRAENFVEDGSWLTGTTPIGLFKFNSNTAVATQPESNVTLATQLLDMATYVASSTDSGTNFSAAYRSVFFRKTFTVSGSLPRAILLRVLHNDAAMVWINGVEVGRFGFPPGAPADPAYNTTSYYERGNDGWSEVALLNAGALLHTGTNTLAIEGFAKLPQTRPDQGDVGNYNVFDFSVDAEIKNAPESLGTPGAQNSVFASNAPPAIRNVGHSPRAPKSWQPVTVSARVSDPQGVNSVQLAYQVCVAGNFIPATLPLSRDALLADPYQAQPLNPAFEDAANWTTLAMVDDGSVAGDVPGDGIFTARLPVQAPRTLVRYRITATDRSGFSGRIPATNDPRRNYAYYVYDAVPNYVANGTSYSAATLTTLPVYQWITRAADFTQLLAYTTGDQFANSIDLKALLARRYENSEGAMVVGDQVIDHTLVRLRGGNSRYNGAGKRHFHWKFPQGTPLQAADEQGNVYPRPWEDMLFNKMFGNLDYYDWGLPYEAGGRMWRLIGLPIPEAHWVHFRVVQTAAEAASQTTGDFWGLYQALEYPDGRNFLKARNLPLGNFFKLSDWIQNGEMDERYQAKDAPDFGEDFDNIRYNIHQTASEAFIKNYVNMPMWYRYNALQEAMRHYDIFTEPTGRHRVKNLIWYFAPKEGTNGLGQVLYMPYDWDASFGPNFNGGRDNVVNAIDGTLTSSSKSSNLFLDSPTWTGILADRTNMKIERRNAIRELRDLFWYRDSATGRGPVDDVLDDALATINAFWPVDRARWPASGAHADYTGGAPAKAQDMKTFAFSAWTDSWTADGTAPAVGAGGRAAYLDTISDAIDNSPAATLPATPTITYTGTAGFPVDGLSFQSSAFSDPQGTGTFGAMQWRIGEITNAAAPAYNPSGARIYEITPIWESGDLTAFNPSVAIPATVLRNGHTYRARVRHKDTTGRWGHWSSPAEFTTTAANYPQVLAANLMVEEVMYHPAAPSGAESAAGYLEGDFEYIELHNVSNALSLDLTNVRLTKGVDFDFANGSILSLAPGGRVLVVKNVAAFTMRYGAGKPVTGAWAISDNLSNGGEEVKLSYGTGTAIQQFTYDDASPWPVQGDLGGYSLVLKKPESRPNHALAANWRACYVVGGNPGGDDRSSFGAWAAANQGASGPEDDLDGDGISNFAEYGLRGNPHEASRGILPASTLQVLNVGGLAESYLTLSFQRDLSREDVNLSPEWSSDLVNWSANGVMVSSSTSAQSIVSEVWRSPLPTSAGSYFGRVRVTPVVP